MNILNSINHLLKQVKCVSKFIALLSRLFSVLKHRSSRNELCAIFQTIKDIDVNLTDICNIFIDLNSWDAKRLEEPDYMLRLDAFKRLNAIIRDLNEFNENIGLLLIYNCCYFINNMEDLAIKESSTNCLLEFMRKSSILNLTNSNKYLFEVNLINEIKLGLRNMKSESCRHEFINLLLNFIRIFENIFPKFKDLLLLTDTENVDRDFYENIKHIQVS